MTAASYGIAPAEEAARTQRVAELRELLARNQLVRAPRDEAPAAPAPERESALLERERRQLSLGAREAASAAAPSAQAGFDRLAAAEAPTQAGALGSRADASEVPLAKMSPSRRSRRMRRHRRRSSSSSEETPSPMSGRSASRKRSSPNRPSCRTPRQTRTPTRRAAKVEVSVRTFASEIDPFELGVLDTGHLVLFRNVWREGQRYVQGALIDREVFVTSAIEMPYRAQQRRERQPSRRGVPRPRSRSVRRRRRRVSLLGQRSSRARSYTARACRRRSATSSSRSSSTRCRARRVRRCSPGSR